MIDISKLAGAIRNAIAAASSGEVISQHIVTLDGEITALGAHLDAQDKRIASLEGDVSTIRAALQGDEDALDKLAVTLNPDQIVGGGASPVPAQDPAPDPVDPAPADAAPSAPADAAPSNPAPDAPAADPAPQETQPGA